MNHAPRKTVQEPTIRTGSILIIVAGVSALLASLTLTFLVRMRSDVEESVGVMAHAQAKVMLAAACHYVQESSRLGYDQYSASDRTHNESFGWVDVRDGKIGPLGNNGRPVQVVRDGQLIEWSQSQRESVGNGRMRPQWPAIGGVARCPMYRLEVPPYAIALTAAPNAMQVANPADTATYCWPLLTRPDPMPVLPNGYDATAVASGGQSGVGNDAARYVDFARGRPTPVASTSGRAWFRVMRDGPSTFLVTCGSGGTHGFRDWNEVEAAGAPSRALFLDDPSFFETQRSSEIRLWYRIEWSASVMEQTSDLIKHDIGTGHPHYVLYPPNASQGHIGNGRSLPGHRNPVGTIRWIQRLVREPTHW